jgi:hypothetical protein
MVKSVISEVFTDCATGTIIEISEIRRWNRPSFRSFGSYQPKYRRTDCSAPEDNTTESYEAIYFDLRVYYQLSSIVNTMGTESEEMYCKMINVLSNQISTRGYHARAKIRRGNSGRNKLSMI